MTDKIVGWEKLNRKCSACGGDHSDLAFTFATRYGTREECYHRRCCPPHLIAFQLQSELDMTQTAMTPPGSAS